MAFDLILDRLVNNVVSQWGAVRKTMFGGKCYTLHGNMMCGVFQDYVILRLGEEEAEKALDDPLIRKMERGGRDMKGWVRLEEDGFSGDRLEFWLKMARDFVETLPPK